MDNSWLLLAVHRAGQNLELAETSSFTQRYKHFSITPWIQRDSDTLAVAQDEGYPIVLYDLVKGNELRRLSQGPLAHAIRFHRMESDWRSPQRINGGGNRELSTVISFKTCPSLYCDCH